MNNWQACIIAVCVATMGVSASAHDTHAGQSLYGSYPLATNQTHNHANQVVHAQYNPWRAQPQLNHNNGRRAVHAHNAGNPLQVQVAPSVVQRVYPLHPLYQRQVEYRDYVHYYNSPAGYGTGTVLPWWSDPVAVPYGPWALGNGWPGGIW